MASRPETPDVFLELHDKFWDLYYIIREDTLTLETDNPADFKFAGNFIAEQRNAIDYFAMAYKNKDEETLTIAIKSLQEAGCDVLEFILIQKIKQLQNCIGDVNKFLKRLIYPNKVREYLIAENVLILGNLNKARSLKPLGYYKAKPEFSAGIELAKKVINNYELSKLEGMQKGERRYNWIITFVIGLVVGIFVVLIKYLISAIII